ncbi:MAG: flippase-like domain-containing protein [Deltaproteobacteria bacterium]|nr:flippase-like domain-containing protein [Deltaproteobacteria bacterium]
MIKRQAIIGLIFSSVFIYLAFRNVEWGLVWQVLHEIDSLYILPFILCGILVQIIRNFRWAYILEPVERIEWWPLFAITSVGFMAICILPARLGEFVRPYLISRARPIRMSSAMATVVLERVMDGMALVLILVPFVFIVPMPRWVAPLGIFAAILFFASFGILLMLALYRTWALERIQWLLKWIPSRLSVKIMNLLNSFVDGLDVLPSARKAIGLLAYTILLWFLYAVMAWILFFSFRFPLGFREALILEIIVGLALMIPAAPAFVGNFHIGSVVALSLFDIAKAPAISYALLLHVLTVSVIMGLGLIFLLVSPVPMVFRVKDVVKAARS